MRGMSMPTVSEMYRLILDAEIPVTRKTVERLFRIYKVTPAKAKRGPKPGTKQKSVHRRLRSSKVAIHCRTGARQTSP